MRDEEAISTYAGADDLCADVEVAQRVEGDGELLLGPLAADVAPPVLDERAEIEVEELVDLVDRLLEALLRICGYVQVQRRVALVGL